MDNTMLFYCVWLRFTQCCAHYMSRALELNCIVLQTPFLFLMQLSEIYFIARHYHVWEYSHLQIMIG